VSQAALVNHQVRLGTRPAGMVTRDDFTYTDESVGEPGEGEMLVRVLYISLDPAMRGWMNEGRSYVRPVDIGDVMRSIDVGRVVASNNPKFGPGDYVVGVFGAQEYAISDGSGVTKVDPNLAPLPVYLSVLGMPGMTAYFGLLDVCQPKEGETVVVSGAAGAVGQVVGQIARIKGCRAVGIAGGPEKCDYIVNELGFDVAIDYKAEDVRAALKEKCPDRINVYFDNVGGEILEAALARLARGARIAICGAVSQYNNMGSMTGPRNYMALLVDRARMQGFVVFDYASRYGEAALEMAGWMAEGKLKSREEIVEGLDAFPEAMQRLFTGEKLGKLVLKVGDE
jgi:NADPH-dependent curcumin reductase CurA